MTPRPSISFARHAAPKKGSVVLLSAEGGGLGEAAKGYDPGNALERAFAVADFSGKSGSTVEVIAPQGSALDRLVVVGVGKASNLKEYDWLKLGGQIAAQFRKAAEVAVVLDLPDTAIGGRRRGGLAAGILLRAYNFDKYKTKKDDADGKPADQKPSKFTIHCADPGRGEKGLRRRRGGGGRRHAGARPRQRARQQARPGRVRRRDEGAGKARRQRRDPDREGDDASSAWARCSASRRARRAAPAWSVMQWNGGKAKDKPVAFVGKGVTFDTGGNSMKPAAGMEDMKGDMGGAAAVTGLMHALAARKAKVNVVGIIGLVENAVDGHAQRPGDIVTSMSGQTIEVLNTDAEGRLVLADALWYCNQRFEPKFMVNLATLTGAIMVALGQGHAGLFSNDDELSGPADRGRPRDAGEGLAHADGRRTTTS